MRKFSKTVFILGCLLIAASLVLLVALRVQAQRAERRNQEIVQTLAAILPDRREGIVDPERDPEMPALELRGQDFIALLEIPSYGLKLPVRAAWDPQKVSSHPCRFSCSVSDSSLVIGGNDQSGQFDFFDRISDGTAVTLTDMTGSTFSFVVEWVERSASADAETLTGSDYALTLFVRDAQLLEYIILRCGVK